MQIWGVASVLASWCAISLRLFPQPLVSIRFGELNTDTPLCNLTLHHHQNLAFRSAECYCQSSWSPRHCISIVLELSYEAYFWFVWQGIFRDELLSLDSKRI